MQMILYRNRCAQGRVTSMTCIRISIADLGSHSVPRLPPWWLRRLNSWVARLFSRTFLPGPELWLHLKFMCLRHFCLMVVVFLVFDIEYKLMTRGFLRLLLIVMNNMKTIFLSGKFLQFYAPFLLFSCVTSSQAHTESIRIITMGSMKFLFVMQTFDCFFWWFTESSQLELGPHPCVTARIAESSWSRHKTGQS